MATVYRTRQNDMVDMICRATYGDESGYVERVYDANPGLSELPMVLPTGTLIVLPDLPQAAAVVPVVSLWD